jgi:hypothetical protein
MAAAAAVRTAISAGSSIAAATGDAAVEVVMAFKHASRRRSRAGFEGHCTAIGRMRW